MESIGDVKAMQRDTMDIENGLWYQESLVLKSDIQDHVSQRHLRSNPQNQ